MFQLATLILFFANVARSATSWTTLERYGVKYWIQFFFFCKKILFDIDSTWSVTPFTGFYEVPLTLSAAKSKGWESLLTCGDSGTHGNVYWLKSDLSTMPMYNGAGNLAGVILGMTNPGTSSQKYPFNKYTAPDGLIKLSHFIFIFVFLLRFSLFVFSCVFCRCVWHKRCDLP